MPFDIEILSVGGDFDAEIEEAAQMLNGVQDQFRFHLPPIRLSTWGRSHFKAEHYTEEVFQFLENYLDFAKGGRRYVIGVIDQKLRSDRLGNLFGSHRAENGVAVVTLRDWVSFTESSRQFLCYYLIRYSLSFLNPALRSHKETRDCFFDRKILKTDIQKSLVSGRLCPEHKEQLASVLTPEVNDAFNRMTQAMKGLRDDSTDELLASSLKNQVDIGIITMKPEEYRAVLDRFSRQREVVGGGSNYIYTRVTTPRNSGKEELRVVIARTATQAQGAAQSLASSMLVDLNPRWLLLVGIAGGIPATEFSLGDVVLSQRMHDFSVSAVKDGKPTEYEDLGGPMTPAVDKLLQALPQWLPKLGAWSNQNNIGRPRPEVAIPADETDPKLNGPEPWSKKIIQGLVANFAPGKSHAPIALPVTFITSNTLLKSVELAKSWLTNARQSQAVEMELAGVVAAARAVGDAETRVFSIRGISDIIGYERSPEWTEYSCHSAAAFTHALIANGIIRRK
jgi:nucleoside phosphorylase